MFATKKKNYMVPETAAEQFLRPMGILMESMGNGAGNTDPKDDEFHLAPKRRVF